MSKKEKIKDISLYGWMFTFNPYMGKWAGYHRDSKYFNGEGPVWYDKDINKLVEIIKKEIHARNNNS
jgi:hypothetical protein